MLRYRSSLGCAMRKGISTLILLSSEIEWKTRWWRRRVVSAVLPFTQKMCKRHNVHKKDTRYASQRENMLNTARRWPIPKSLDAQFGLLDAYLQRVELNVYTHHDVCGVSCPCPTLSWDPNIFIELFAPTWAAIRQCSGREISKHKATGENLQHLAEPNLFVYCISNLLVNLGRRKQRRYSHTQYMRYLFSMILFRFYDLKILCYDDEDAVRDAQSAHTYICVYPAPAQVNIQVSIVTMHAAQTRRALKTALCMDATVKCL